MNFWKSITIALAVVLGLSYAGFAYVYSQGGGIMIAGMVTGGMQQKVVTLLKNSNITNPLNWNISVDTTGYKTGCLYYQTIDMHNREYYRIGLSYRFEVDEIFGTRHSLGSIGSDEPENREINIVGAKMWISTAQLFVIVSGPDPQPESPQWAVISMSLYLRD